jgi:phage repressor protein C with HTH and peptisase S24 domain
MKGLLEAQNLSQSELARRVGISQSAVAQLLSRGGQGSKHIHAIARELHTTPAFLMGEIDDPSEKAVQLPSASTVAEQLDAVLLPEVEVSYSMGGGADISDWPVVRQVPFSRDWLRTLTSSPASDLMVARGDGDSMQPTILDGDLTIIDRGQQTMRQQDRIWALSYGGFGMIKRLRALPDGSLQINSDNTAVTPILATDDEAFLIGRVVGVIRRI